MKKIIYIFIIIIFSITVFGALSSYSYQQFVNANIDKDSLGIVINGYELVYDVETDEKSASFSIVLDNYVVDNGSVMVIDPLLITYYIGDDDIDSFKSCRVSNSKVFCRNELIDEWIKPFMLSHINVSINNLKDEQVRISYLLSDDDVYDELVGLDIGVI